MKNEEFPAGLSLYAEGETSINKNKQIYFFLFFSLYFYIDVFIFPTIVGTEGLYILRKLRYLFIC